MHTERSVNRANGGTRDTSARRYDYDDPTATVIVIREEGSSRYCATALSGDAKYP